MAYSRWSNSNWYVYCDCNGYLYCGGPAELRWYPFMSYDEFQCIVTQEVADAALRDELFGILERNMDEIQEDLAYYRGENDKYKSLEDNILGMLRSVNRGCAKLELELNNNGELEVSIFEVIDWRGKSILEVA